MRLLQQPRTHRCAPRLHGGSFVRHHGIDIGLHHRPYAGASCVVPKLIRTYAARTGCSRSPRALRRCQSCCDSGSNQRRSDRPGPRLSQSRDCGADRGSWDQPPIRRGILSIPVVGQLCAWEHTPRMDLFRRQFLIREQQCDVADLEQQIADLAYTRSFSPVRGFVSPMRS